MLLSTTCQVVYLIFCPLLSTCLSSSEYGFAEKVVEGMSLSINSIVIRISAKAFNASFELSQLQVHSVNTSWSISDLRFTRIQDPQRGEVCLYVFLSFRRLQGCRFSQSFVS